MVARLWDERRLVLPCTYFTKTPFANWTRNATALLGTVEMDVDFSVPLDDMRAELDRLLRSNELWDGRANVLQVTDAVAGAVRVRMLVSAANAGPLFDLRCDVREGMVNWLQRTQRGAVLRHRVEHSRGEDFDIAESTGSQAGAPGQPLADSGLFSGSPEADERARSFQGPDDDDYYIDEIAEREFARVRRE